MLFIVFYSAFYFPDTLLNRPHPILWRVVQGVGCIYLIMLVLILEIDSATAKQIIKYLAPTLLTAKPVETACVNSLAAAFTFPVIRRTLGWCFKMLIFRNVWLCAFVITFYFVMELSFRVSLGIHMCWFELIVLDFLVSGIVGITLGYFACQYLEGHTKKWFSRNHGNISIFAKLFELCHPNVWWNYEWKIFKLSLIHICRCRRYAVCRSRWSPYH
eukprot:TRINITY_DN13206_c0_g2_i4.p1 TRINITY_DN13206_c0_g2~~TRINITY_DN13206_c0_g2_i4.p1  ORF type:complete len:216 (+),score=58.89 TRINITY_DN13206_c0_g2_i4:422-1069(+)